MMVMQTVAMRIVTELDFPSLSVLPSLTLLFFAFLSVAALRTFGAFAFSAPNVVLFSFAFLSFLTRCIRFLLIAVFLIHILVI